MHKIEEDGEAESEAESDAEPEGEAENGTGIHFDKVILTEKQISNFNQFFIRNNETVFLAYCNV